MDLKSSSQKAIVQIIGSDCFDKIEFSENICLTTKITVLVDQLTEYEYVFEHVFDRSEECLYRKGDKSSQTEEHAVTDREVQTDPGEEVIAKSENEKDFVEVKVEKRDEIDLDTGGEDDAVTEVIPQSPASPVTQKRQRSKPEDVSCPLCPAKFTEQDSAEQHLKICHDIGNFYVCSICQHICNSKLALVDHLKENHPGQIAGESSTRKRGRPRKCEPKKFAEVSDSEEKKSEEKKPRVKTAKKYTAVVKKTKKKGKVNKLTIKKVKNDAKQEEAEDYEGDTDVEGEENKKPSPMKKNIADDTYVPRDGNKVKCIKCGKEYKSRRALRRHFASRHDEEGQEYQCDLCGKSFTSKDSLYHHKRGVHQNLKIYKCPEPGCDATFNFNHSLRLHKLKHSGNRPHMCSTCGKTYLTGYHLKVHIQATHSAKSFSCTHCGKMFSYSTSLKMHEATHQKQQRVSCDQCAKTFVNLQALKYHIMSKHTEPGNYSCEECGKVCKTEFLLRAHKKRHSLDGSRFMCDICGRQFMYKSAMEMHRAIHRDDKQYKCKVCNKSFKTYPTLYSHQYVHKEDSPYCCAQCGKAFKTKERCKAHEKRHSGLKPFECNICHHCFPDNGGLSKHMRTVHCAVKKFVCDICGKATSRADNLRVHMKVHAKGDIGSSKPYKRSESKSAKNSYNLPSMLPLTFDNENELYTGKKEMMDASYYNKDESNDTLSQSPGPIINRDNYTPVDMYQANIPNFSTLDTSQLAPQHEDQILPLNLHSQASVPHTTSSNSYQLPLLTNHSNHSDTVSPGPENSGRISVVTSTNAVSTSSGNMTVTTLQPPHLPMYAWPYVYSGLQPQSANSNSYFHQQ